MTNIKKMIHDLCPSKVEFLVLGDIATIKNGKDYKHLEKGIIPVYGSGGVMTYVNDFVYDKPSVLIPRKGSLNKLYYTEGAFWNVDTVFYTEINEKIIFPKFLFYYLQTQHLENLNNAGGVPSLTQSILNRVLVPILPLKIQKEIVHILDKFTDLKTSLETELEVRKQQYEYYRLRFFSSDKIEQWTNLGEIAEIGTGSSNTHDELDDGTYPFFVRSQTVRSKNEYEFDEEAIITSGDGVGVGKIFHYVNGKYALHQRAYRIHIMEPRVMPKYFYYYMKSTFYKYITMNAYSSSVTSIRRPMLLNYPVPIIPLDEQRKIIQIFDKFETLIENSEKGIPAEINLLQQQYEYYRDKLLTFKRAN